MNIVFDNTYLNRTPHHSPRSRKTTHVVWHETAGMSGKGTLEWGLNPKSKVSWHYLIDRDGTVYRYLDPLRFTAWHAGRATVSNEESIGVEVEGPNNGTPITEAQRDAILGLMRVFQQEFGIPLTRDRHVEHREIALPKGRKSDPRGFSVDVALRLALAGGAPAAPADQALQTIQEHLRQAEQAIKEAQAAVERLRNS